MQSNYIDPQITFKNRTTDKYYFEEFFNHEYATIDAITTEQLNQLEQIERKHIQYGNFQRI